MKEQKNIFRYLMAVTVFLIVSSILRLNVYATSVTVIKDQVKVRQDAGTTSEVVTSVGKDTKLEVISEKTGAEDNQKWYEIKTPNGTVGYVRADMVTTDSAAAAAPTASADGSVNTKEARIKNETGARIRSTPSTDGDNVLTTLSKGAIVNVALQTKDDAGNTWYKVTFTKDGAQLSGYVRSDMITFGSLDDGSTQITPPDPALPEEDGAEDAAETDEFSDYNDLPTYEETQAAPATSLGFVVLTPPSDPKNLPPQFVETTVSLIEGGPKEKAWKYGDFIIIYAQKDNGDVGFYQYDITENVLQRYVPLEPAKAGTLEKVLIAVLSVICVALAAVVVILFIRGKNQSDHDYYDDDDDDDDDDYENEDPRLIRRMDNHHKTAEIIRRPQRLQQPRRESSHYQEQKDPARSAKQVNRSVADKDELTFLEFDEL